MATISMSSKFCTAARSTLRPMRPKPLMPTLIAMDSNSCKDADGKARYFSPRPTHVSVMRPFTAPSARRARIAALALVLGALLLVAPLAFGWSALGHRLVGKLAQRHLDPQAQAEVAALLAGEPEPTLAGVATWADELRNSNPPRFKATSKWHYINAKGGGCDFDLERDCPGGDCVVA